jgi:hypothetical protein
VSSNAVQEKQAEMIAVSNVMTSQLGFGIRVPVEWEQFAANICRELRNLGAHDLASDVVAEKDGVALRWTRLGLESISSSNYTFTLDQTLAQKAKEVSE